MAQPGRTVRVSGLPTDIENNRLQDKLFIHFLRAKNGGGEVDSVIIVKATPLSALITFEDSAVAQRVIQRSRHILEVDGKKYKLTATKHQERLDPDEVILSLSATVDYSQLPGGFEVLTNLWKDHREIQINNTAADMCCTVFGSYSKVQAALTQLLGNLGGPEPVENKDSGQTSPSSSSSVLEDQSRKPKQRERRKKDNTGRSSDEDHLSSNTNVAPEDEGWEATANTDDAAHQSPPAFTEDFSLIVDADMFQYLQKHCKKEYQRILSQNGVEVINVTQQGVTTLILKAADTAATEGVQIRLELAKKAISQLYQQNEVMIRRAQLSKGILHPRGGLQKALEILTDIFPKLLLNEDEQNLYLIGSIKDVSEAKSFLILDHDGVRDKKEDVASLLKVPLYNSSLSPTHTDEGGVSLTPPSILASSEEKTDQMLRSDEEGFRAEGATKYKLAARFKDSGLTGLGSRPADFSIWTNSSSSRHTRQGPMLGHDVLSEPAGISDEVVSRGQHTGGDILFKTTSPSTASTKIKTSLTEAHSKSSLSPSGTTHSGFAELPSFGSGSSLRRTSSFSGTPQRKAQVVDQISPDDSSKPTVRSRGRSSSFSSQTAKDKQEVHGAGITVSQIMWQYINEAYSTRVDDLTTDVKLEETISEGGRDLNVIIRGADLSKVRSCQERLQRLVKSVSADFTVKEIRFSELSVTDPEDETLQACCTEVQSRFKKVSLHKGRKGVYLFGPDQLCSQVAATLREVFSGKPEPLIFSSPSTLVRNSAPPPQFDEPQSFSLQLNNSSQVVLETQTDSGQWKTTYKSDFGEKGDVNGAYSQSPVRKDLFNQETVKISRKAEGSVSLTRNDTSPVNGISLVAANKDKIIRATYTDSSKHRNAEVQNTPEESRPGLVQSCVCGENGTSLMRTKCGVTLCPQCLEREHLHCRVCSETEQTPRGIQGEMKVSKLPIILQGHSRDNTIKITYSIPDGIQGEGHPAPGKPFKGGVFEAFLPDSEKVKKLVPRLKEAFRQGLTFTVREKGAEAWVDWDCIPHKTSLHGGKALKAYPDSTYLKRLSDILTSHKIE